MLERTYLTRRAIMEPHACPAGPPLRPCNLQSLTCAQCCALSLVASLYKSRRKRLVTQKS